MSVCVAVVVLYSVTGGDELQLHSQDRGEEAGGAESAIWGPDSAGAESCETNV